MVTFWAVYMGLGYLKICSKQLTNDKRMENPADVPIGLELMEYCVRAACLTQYSYRSSCCLQSTNIQNEVLNAIDDGELYHKLYTNETPSVSARMQDYGYVNKEPLMLEVTLCLLWEEATSKCLSVGQL